MGRRTDRPFRRHGCPTRRRRDQHRHVDQPDNNHDTNDAHRHGDTANTTAARVNTAPARRTRTGQLQSSPGRALAGLAGRSLLPHTQSDRRRPLSAIARSVATSGSPDGAIGDSATATSGGWVDPASTAARAVESNAVTHLGQPAPMIARSLDSTEAAQNALTDVDRALVRPMLATSDSDRPQQLRTDTRPGDAVRSNQASAPRTARPAATNPTLGSDVTTAFDERPDSGHVRLARPGRMGRIASDDLAPVGLQRHSVVSPGPGALQRALAEMSSPDGERIQRSPNEPARTSDRVRRTSTPSLARIGTVAPLTVTAEAITSSDAATTAVIARRQLDPSIAAPAAPDTARLPAGPPAAPPSPSQVPPVAKTADPVQRTATPAPAPATNHPATPTTAPGTPTLHPAHPPLHPAHPPLHPAHPPLHPAHPPLHPAHRSLGASR